MIGIALAHVAVAALAAIGVAWPAEPWQSEPRPLAWPEEPWQAESRPAAPTRTSAMDHTPPWGPATASKLRQCEAWGDYTIDTGNGFSGAYQFTQSSWELVGGTGRPHDASPGEQDNRAAALWQRQGWHAWPGCSCSFGWISRWEYGGIRHEC